MALYIPAWSGETPQNGRTYLRAIRMSLKRTPELCEVQVYLSSPAPSSRQALRGATLRMVIPTTTHDMYLFGGDVVLRADAQLIDDSDLEVTSLYLGDASYPVS